MGRLRALVRMRPTSYFPAKAVNSVFVEQAVVARLMGGNRLKHKGIVAKALEIRRQPSLAQYHGPLKSTA